MFKIDLTNQAVPKVTSPSGFIFDNAKGGPYKYGWPIVFNKAAIAAVKAGRL